MLPQLGRVKPSYTRLFQVILGYVNLGFVTSG